MGNSQARKPGCLKVQPHYFQAKEWVLRCEKEEKINGAECTNMVAVGWSFQFARKGVLGNKSSGELS